MELVSPLVSRGTGVDGRGWGSKHPGSGFGYNGPDPRVRFTPQASRFFFFFRRCRGEGGGGRGGVLISCLAVVA